ncbi:hypothetical protein GCM10023196_036260 [Actinoallomurus vinaceus]|uniref:Uncharacterized protein n=1 Tax=Actinoallomurus vinaceus TaxID=1080074 RepID=A0ABP8UCT4_9ACTN
MTEASAETRCAKTETLLAVMNEDDERLDQLVDEMLAGELRVLRDHAVGLRKAIDGRLRTPTPSTGEDR